MSTAFYIHTSFYLFSYYGSKYIDPDCSGLNIVDSEIQNRNSENLLEVLTNRVYHF
jgi:hypothetical protein